MNKKVVIVVELVPEANEINDVDIETEIKESVSCDWLLRVEGVRVRARAKTVLWAPR